jgi:hypothetical protein
VAALAAADVKDILPILLMVRSFTRTNVDANSFVSRLNRGNHKLLLIARSF